ncbi:MAG: alpha/beta fold hydrolase [Ilumatobacteraceae bacterium]
MNEVTMLLHGKVSLALHRLQDGNGRPLLLLHGLGEESPRRPPPSCAAWPGPIIALDFTGHGRSSIPRGGGYTAESLLGDADVALAELGCVTVVGRGLGAYIALQLAGARATAVRGAVLADGPGLAGGSVQPTSSSFATLVPRAGAPDPYALFEMSRDLRPPDYATEFVRMARERSGLDEPVTIAAVIRPAWLAGVADEVGVAQATVHEALVVYAALP